MLTLIILFLLYKGGNSIFSKEVTLLGTFKAFIDVSVDGEIWKELYFSTYSAIKGFLIGAVLAILFGIVLGILPKSKPLITNLLNSWRAIPLTLLIPFLTFIPAIAVIPLFAKNFNAPNRDLSVIIAIGSFQYMLLGIIEGISKRSKIRENFYVNVAKHNRLWYIWNILRFEIMPFFLHSIRMAIIFSIVLQIVLEQIIPYEGIGRNIYNLSNGSQRGETTMRMIGLMVFVAYFGIFVDRGFRWLIRKSTRWSPSIVARQ